jgi:hypothetical protein
VSVKNIRKRESEKPTRACALQLRIVGVVDLTRALHDQRERYLIHVYIIHDLSELMKNWNQEHDLQTVKSIFMVTTILKHTARSSTIEASSSANQCANSKSDESESRMNI